MTVTVAAAAKQLGVTERRVREAIRSGRLPATRASQVYQIAEADLAVYAARLADPAAARAADRHARMQDEVLRSLPASRAELRASLRRGDRGGLLTAVLTELIDTGRVLDPGRGHALQLAGEQP